MARELIVVQPNLKGLPEPLAYYDPELQNAWNEGAPNPKRLQRAVAKSRKLRAAYMKQLSSLRSRVDKRTYRLFSSDRDPLFDSNLFEFTFGDYLDFATRLRKVRPHVEVRAAFLSFEEDTLHELRYGGIRSLRVNVPDERWFQSGGNVIDSLLAHELVGAGKELMLHTCLFVSGTTVAIRCSQLSWSKRPFAVDKSPYRIQSGVAGWVMVWPVIVRYRVLTPMSHISWQVVTVACVGAVCAVTANLLSFKMIEKLNNKLPEHRKISYLWWGTEVRRNYKEMYARDGIVIVHDLCLAGVVLCFLLALKYWVFA